MLKYNRNYFADFEFWRKQKIKSKKHFKNIMAVMYGKKKDRGGIKKKYLALMKEQEETQRLMREAIDRVCPQLSGVLKYLNCFGTGTYY